MNLIKIVFITSLLNLAIFTGIGVFLKNNTSNVIVANNIFPTPTAFLSPTKIPIKTTTSLAPAPTTPPIAVPTTDTRCIITIDGGRYNVTQFRSIHSGGDIFQCGTDMTNIFYQQHNQSYLSRMAQYKI